MNREERVVKYINSADELIFNGKRYCENDFYNDVEDLEKENKKYKKVIDKAIKLIEDTYYSKNTTDIDSIVLSNNELLKIRKILKEVE